jgi:hypothetical protein
VLYVPVLNVPRADFPLRTDISYAFREVRGCDRRVRLERGSRNDGEAAQEGVETKELLFIDELQPLLGTLLASGRLSVTLVDHNKLPNSQESLAGVVRSSPLLHADAHCRHAGAAQVREIVDHHKDEGAYVATVTRRVIEPVGSCATLVTFEYMEAGLDERLLDAPAARLLLATILVRGVCVLCFRRVFTSCALAVGCAAGYVQFRSEGLARHGQGPRRVRTTATSLRPAIVGAARSALRPHAARAIQCRFAFLERPSAARLQGEHDREVYDTRAVWHCCVTVWR